MKMNLKLKQILLIIFILVATAMIAITLYNLFYHVDPVNLGNMTSNNNLINNQLTSRDVQNVSSNFTTNNVTFPSNEPSEGVKTGTLTTGLIIIGILIVGGVYCILATYGKVPFPCSAPLEAANEAAGVSREFLDNN